MEAADALATAAHDKNQLAIQRLQQRIISLDELQQRLIAAHMEHG